MVKFKCPSCGKEIEFLEIYYDGWATAREIGFLTYKDGAVDIDEYSDFEVVDTGGWDVSEMYCPECGEILDLDDIIIIEDEEELEDTQINDSDDEWEFELRI